jgi:poly(hydroxyalkanoate) depolymerase family esterase
MLMNNHLFSQSAGTRIGQFTGVIAVAMVALVLNVIAPVSWAGTFYEVTDFGSNPGNLRMFKYIPDNLPAVRPLVVALHGCTQSASTYDNETGWTQFADQWKFALLLPEQKKENNSSACFNWFEPGDIQRDRGEALSIRQMIGKMQADHQSDPKRIYVTGLSAGGGMTSVMLATYPEIFVGGGIIAGLPYRCASGLSEAFSCLNPGKDLSPSQWGDRVRAATDHTGPWPKVSIWHGDADFTVRPLNASELVEQWTNVHGIDQVPEVEDRVKGYPHKVFKDAEGQAQVEIYTIVGIGHGTPVDPGPGEEQCGSAGAFILDTNICSSLFIARFWGLDEEGGPAPPTNLRNRLLQQIKRLEEDLQELRPLVEQLPAQ